MFGNACGGSGIVTSGGTGACAGGGSGIVTSGAYAGGGTGWKGNVGGVHVSWLEEALEPHVALVEKLLYSAQLFLYSAIRFWYVQTRSLFLSHHLNWYNHDAECTHIKSLMITLSFHEAQPHRLHEEMSS